HPEKPTWVVDERFPTSVLSLGNSPPRTNFHTLRFVFPWVDETNADKCKPASLVSREFTRVVGSQQRRPPTCSWTLRSTARLDHLHSEWLRPPSQQCFVNDGRQFFVKIKYLFRL